MDLSCNSFKRHFHQVAVSRKGMDQCEDCISQDFPLQQRCCDTADGRIPTKGTCASRYK